MAERARSLHGRGRVDEAELWLRRAVRAGYEEAVGDLYELLRDQGRNADLEPWQQRAAEAGFCRAMDAVIENMVSTDRLDDIRQWLAAKPGGQRRYGWAATARALTRMGRLDEAEQWARALAADEKAYTELLVTLLIDQGAAGEVGAWIGQLAREAERIPYPVNGPPRWQVLERAVRFLVSEGQTAQAEAQLREAVEEAGSRDGIWPLVELLLAARKVDEAAGWLQQLTERCTDLRAFKWLLDLRSAQGRAGELEPWLRGMAGGADALAQWFRYPLTEFLLHQNRPAEAEALLRPEAEKSRWQNPDLARALAAQGRIDEAVAWLHPREGPTVGDSWQAQCRRRRGTCASRTPARVPDTSNLIIVAARTVRGIQREEVVHMC